MLSEPRYPFPDRLPVVDAVAAGRQVIEAGMWGFGEAGSGRRLVVNPVERVAAWTDTLLGPLQWSPLPESLDIDPSARPWERPRWTFDETLTRVAVFEVGEMAVHDSSGVRFRREHPPGWAADSGRPRLGGVFIESFLWCVVTESGADRHRLMVIDCQDWRETASTILEASSPEGFLVWAHPSRQGVVVDAGRGQDGTDLWTVQRVADGLAVRHLDRDDQAFSGSFLGDGSLLLLPHTGERVSISSWPDLAEVAQLSNSDVFDIDLPEGGDEFSWCGFAFGDRHLLLMTVAGRLVLVDHRERKPVAEIRIPGFGWQSTQGSDHPDPDLFAVRQIADNRFAADHQQRLDHTVWAIPI